MDSSTSFSRHPALIETATAELFAKDRSPPTCHKFYRGRNTMQGYIPHVIHESVLVATIACGSPHFGPIQWFTCFLFCTPDYFLLCLRFKSTCSYRRFQQLTVYAICFVLGLNSFPIRPGKLHLLFRISHLVHLRAGGQSLFIICYNAIYTW